MVQVKKFAPHLHHTIKYFAILRNFIDKYNMLIIFAIHIKVANYQRIYKRYKIAIFKYCPGHTEIKSQPIINQLRFFICHCAATASPMADKRISACDRNKRISTNLSKGGACGRPRPFSNPCAYVPPLVQLSSVRYANDPQAGKRPAIRPSIFRCEIHKTRKIPANRKIPGRQKPGKRYFPAVRRP